MAALLQSNKIEGGLNTFPNAMHAPSSLFGFSGLRCRISIAEGADMLHSPIAYLESRPGRKERTGPDRTGPEDRLWEVFPTC